MALATPAPHARADSARRVTAATALRQTCEGYRAVFVQRDGRVIDRERNQVSTSKGQAYTMLRAGTLP